MDSDLSCQKTFLSTGHEMRLQNQEAKIKNCESSPYEPFIVQDLKVFSFKKVQ